MLLYSAQAVEGFCIGREGIGEVAFLLPVDVCSVNLDAIVTIEKGSIQLYGGSEGRARPVRGTALNMPALLTFRCA